MTSDTPPTNGPTFANFPPIPLVSGDTFRDLDGGAHTIETATFTMTAADGTAREVSLEYRFGGWWAPANPM